MEKLSNVWQGLKKLTNGHFYKTIRLTKGLNGLETVAEAVVAEQPLETH